MANTTSTAKFQNLTGASAAFALSGAIAILFNTGLAWVKDSFPALNSFMASLTGHHWTTHSIFDLIVFFGLGFVFMATGTAERMDGMRLVRLVIGAVFAGGLGLLAWFLIAG